MDAGNLEALQARITRLEDIEAIKQLKALYCEICDDDHNPERIVEIFAEDGIWEGRGIGIARGRAEIRQLFESFRAMMSFSQHMTMNPRIEVQSDTAHGTWYFFGPFTFRAGPSSGTPPQPEARWQAARYVEDYVRIDGVWKIKHLRVRGPAFSALYEEGWT